MNDELQANLLRKIELIQARLADLNDLAKCTEDNITELTWSDAGSLGHLVDLLTQATDHYNITGTVGKAV